MGFLKANTPKKKRGSGMSTIWQKNKPTIITAILALGAIGVVAYDNFSQRSEPSTLRFLKNLYKMVSLT